jgi:DNA polymerase III subunit delta'
MMCFWQQQNWQHLIARYRKDNLPHAMLFTGAVGLGKFLFATKFGQFLLCTNNQRNDFACGKCTSCVLFAANNHPDFVLVQPEDSGKAIKVEQIRLVIEEIANTSHQGGVRVVVINTADAMNIASANALLKTLEEPLGDVVIILVSARQFALPATIISRCQKIEFAVPLLNTATDWLVKEHGYTSSSEVRIALNLAQNAPLQALSLLQNDQECIVLRQKILAEMIAVWQKKNSAMHAVDFATNYADIDSKFLLQLLLSVVVDLLKLRLATTSEFIANIDVEASLREVCKYFSVEKILAYYSYLLELNKIIGSNVALNKQLLLENLWLRLQAVF